MKIRIRSTFQVWLGTALAFLAGVVLIRAYEAVRMVSEVNDAWVEASGGVHDLSIALRFAALVAMAGLVIGLLAVRISFLFQSFAFLAYLFTSWAATQYFIATGQTVGADLLGYSFGDLQTTVGASGGMDAYAWLAVIFIFGSWGILHRHLYNHNPFYLVGTPFSAAALMAVAVAGMLMPSSVTPFDPERSYRMACSKTSYLLTECMESSAMAATTASEVGDYPMLHPVAYHDVLDPYLQRTEGFPNIVLIIVEGLGRDFMGPDARYGGMMPFLDSLSSKSLFWKNTLSNGGRTFGAPPSLLGSLPYGRSGFMNYGADMPDHQTLISLVKPFGYQSQFFYGGNPNFDNLDLFLEYQGTDRFINESTLPARFREGARMNSWGLSDADLFRYAIDEIESMRGPRLDMYLTLSTHEPFQCPDPSVAKEADARLSKLASPVIDEMKTNRSIFQCLYYTDRSLRKLMKDYAKRDDFNETIFIITGDHRLIPMEQESRLSRFHVPLMIWSPLQKKATTFSSLNTHAALLPTLLGWLKTYGLQVPENAPFISDVLNTDSTFTSTLDIALTRNKNVVEDYIEGTTYLSEKKLYTITENMELQPAGSLRKSELEAKLQQWQTLSILACENNRLDPQGRKTPRLQFALTEEETDYLHREGLDTLNPDKEFMAARTLAFAKSYESSRTILHHLLNRAPNFHDARVLLARTHSWERQFDIAETLLNQVIQRSPAYEDAYLALADIAFWQGNYNASVQAARDGLAQNPDSQPLHDSLVRAQQRMKTTLAQ